MSRLGYARRTRRSVRLAVALATGLALPGMVATARAQDGPPPAAITSTPAASAPAPAPATLAPVAPADGPAAEAARPGLPNEVQVVRFQAPPGVTVEILSPAPEPVPQGDGKGAATVGLKVGVAYRLRLANLTDRPGAELFPVIEIVGHLHRPTGIDPGKFPIRVVFTDDDILEVADNGRLVTEIVYLENPDEALPLLLGKDMPVMVTLNPAEEPLKVASALGRVMAVMRIGARKPTESELTTPAGDGMAQGDCPFITTGGGPCKLPCGPVVGTRPPAHRPWMPRDEFLCDGGDRATPLHFAGDGGLTGIDPRDALITFNDSRRPRILPTNTVCIYAPRFAAVRTSLGASESLNVQEVHAAERRQHEASERFKQGPKRFSQNAAAEMNRLRTRPSGLVSKVYAGEHTELRVLGGFNGSTNIKGHVLSQTAIKTKTVARAKTDVATIGAQKLKSAEAVVMTGIVEGPGQTVMTWTPRETVGVDEPPARPGLSVIKQTNVDQAEPGDVVTFTIHYRNMGNTPISAVSVVDSLTPRLEYVPNSANGPAGAVFTAGGNKAGSLELRWDLPGKLAPGAEGTVTFQATVR